MNQSRIIPAPPFSAAVDVLKKGLAPIAHRHVFCAWKLEQDDPASKPKKVPYVRVNNKWARMQGGHEDTDLPSRLMTLDAAIEHVTDPGPNMTGVGIMFYPGCEIVGLDLDKCLAEWDEQSGSMKRRSTPDQERAGSLFGHTYIERSVSGKGLHLIALGGAQTFRAGGSVELFGNKNFLALTGDGAGVASRVETAALEEVREIIARAKLLTGLPGNSSASRATASIVGDEDINRDLTGHGRTELPLPEENPENIRKLGESLAFLDPAMGREDWRNTVWACCDLERCGGWSKAYDAARAWSEKCEEKWDEKDFEGVWQSFAPDKGIHFSTLVHKAKQAGYLGWTTENSGPLDEQGPAVDLQRTMSETLNDAGNAARMIEHFGQDLRYVSEWGAWIGWRDGRWTRDTHGQVVEIAKESARRMFTQAARIGDDGARLRFAKHASASLQERPLLAAVNLAKTIPGVPVALDRIDANPLLFGTDAGVIELRTGEHRECRREDLVLRRSRVCFAPEAKCPVFLGFMSTVLPDSGVRSFVQRAVGYTLTGFTTEQKFFFLYGSGANGKTTFTKIIEELTGSYAVQTQPETFMARDNRAGGNASPDVARLNGARLVLANETEEGQRLSESLVKQMTGGDSIAARELYKGVFEFTPVFKLWLSGNHMPVVRGGDDGIWRRIALVKFGVTIPPEQQDRKLLEKLRAELPGILNWAVEGCIAWQRDGLAVPASVRKDTEQYRSDMDLFQQWFDERVESGPHDPPARWKARDAFRDYCGWAEAGNHRPFSETRFGAKMAERGVSKGRQKDGIYYSGVARKALG